MVGRIYHVVLTVSDLDRSIAFYRDILGLEFQGEIFMKGEETDKMFRRANCKARVAYLNGSKAIEAPPVELIQFVDRIYVIRVEEHTSEIDEKEIAATSMTMREIANWRNNIFNVGFFFTPIYIQIGRAHV